MRFLILGYGRFGHLAAERITEAFPDARIVIVDKHEDALRRAAPAASHVRMDAVEAVHEFRRETECIVVPMVPFHLAAAYVLKTRTDVERAIFPKELVNVLPNPFPADESSVACSKATFLCPDDCPEGELCTVTGLPREPLGLELEQSLAVQAPTYVITSRQILPGVGGYSLGVLAELIRRPFPERFFLATACKCHGFVTALKRRG